MRRILTFTVAFFLVFEAVAQSSVLRIGYIGTDPAGIIQKNKPIVDYLGKNLSASGVQSASIVVAKDLPEMAQLLKAKKVDLFIDTIFPVLSVNALVKLNIDLHRWKKGAGEYRTLFIVAKDSPLKSLGSLKGKRIGFEEPESTSGRWLPQATLLKMGYKLEEIGAGQAVTTDKIGYSITGSSENTTVWLIQGKLDVGCISSTDYDELSQAIKAKIRTLGETANIPRQLIAARQDLPPELYKAVRAKLVAMDKKPETLAILKSWEKTAKVEEIGPDLRKAIAAVTELWALVEKDL